MRPDPSGSAVGFRCAVCGASIPIETFAPWRCPNATATDRHHVLHILGDDGPGRHDPARHVDDAGGDDDDNPFLRYGPRLAWWTFARGHGMSSAACRDLTREVAGGFVETPFEPSRSLRDALGRETWVKDETRNVAGSHKARHLATILLHLRAAEELGMLPRRPPLAIASCGNAAIAAASLAAHVAWPLTVYVPDWASNEVRAILGALGADIVTCERRGDDPPGDPTVHRFREAVAAGAVPFSVQGPENAYCLDGGRTLGWEMVDAAHEHGTRIDRMYVQVGGGALATCVGEAMGPQTALHAVQSEGCAPLARAWNRLGRLTVAEAGGRWGELMWPWAQPASLADGIIDDETYDWLGVVGAMRASGGRPLVVSEDAIADAHRLAASTEIDVSATGSAGLAGALTDDAVGPGEVVGVIFSGVERRGRSSTGS